MNSKLFGADISLSPDFTKKEPVYSKQNSVSDYDFSDDNQADEIESKISVQDYAKDSQVVASRTNVLKRGSLQRGFDYSAGLSREGIEDGNMERN